MIGIITVALSAVVSATACAVASGDDREGFALSFAQLHARFLQRGHRQELGSWREVAHMLAETTVPPPAPSAVSQLHLTTTSLPPSETTMFSPEARLGDNWDSYYNEIRYGRPNINATVSTEILPIAVSALPTLDRGAPSQSTYGVMPTSETTEGPTIDASAATEEIDDAFRADSSKDCTVGEWTEWGDCSATAGDKTTRSWHEVRYRPIITPHILGGLTCPPHVMRRPCPEGGWSSKDAYSSYRYGTGGTSDGVAGGMSYDDIASGAEGASAGGASAGGASASDASAANAVDARAGGSP
eukprot:CAMPEP_0117517710 /NCGR_PEP_ID=MMETSP0784-20121206/31753_1 /TAXON_ID=39447 /ORGANISM="" /LENGTH=299 /DNA_ID=CAMNT_0005313601 /DNA_START=166 /DNA_END=1062 /DNA_ORIENTATION=+